MKTVIDMARAVYGANTEWSFSQLERLEQFAELVRADERNRTWTQDHWTAYECNIVAQERDACARVCDEWPNGRDDICLIAAAIRARGEA